MPIIEQCAVKKVNKGNAFVELTRSQKCDGCKICAFNKNNTIVIPAINDANCKVGDNVLVQMPEKVFSAAPLVLYVIPLVLMFIGILLGGLINDAMQVVLGLVFAAIGFGFAYLIDKLVRRKRKYMPIIKEVVKDNNIDNQTKGETI